MNKDKNTQIPLLINALVFLFEFNISKQFDELRRLEITQWVLQQMYWVFLNILISFLCWNDDFFKENTFSWENLGFVLSISCFSGWGLFAYIVYELLNIISIVSLILL